MRDDSRLGCESGVGGRVRHRDGCGHDHGGRHLSVFSQHDFLQEMVSASLWAEPFLVLVTVAQRDVTGGEKYFWRPSTLVSARGGSSAWVLLRDAWRRRGVWC